MKLLPHKLGLAIGTTSFLVGVGMVFWVAFVPVALLAHYLFAVPAEFSSTSRSNASGSVGVASRVDGSGFQDKDLGTSSEAAAASELDKVKEQDGQHDTSENDDSSDDNSLADDNASESAKASEEDENSEMTTANLSDGTPKRDLLAPLRSQIRAVRAVRFGVFISSILLSMLTVVALLKVNRLSHAKYAGRLWWIGLLVIPAWLLAGLMIAWNNELWESMFNARVG